MIDFFQLLATLAASLFAGAAIYINLAEHPARLECGTQLAVTVFGPSYRRAARMQVLLALVATVAALISWWIGGGLLWLVGALFIFAVIPFTLLAIMPTNKRLVDPGLDYHSEEARILLENWGKRHAVRSILSLIAAVIFLILVIKT